MKPIASILLSVAFLATGSSFGKDAPQANSFNEALAAVPSAEMPAKAADLVKKAPARDWHATTVSVVNSAVGMNPAAAPAIVGAIARAVPDMASVAAGAAAALLPKQAAAIAKAAAAAAPSKAGKIVTAVCRAVPNEYRNIAAAVAQVVPDAGKEIVNAVAAALPGLKPAINSTLAGYGGNVVSVADTLDRAARVSLGSLTSVPASPTVPTLAANAPLQGATMARGPAVGPPYHPLTVTPTNVTPGTSGEVPVGGRDYSAP
jgi:Meckel syndrome type 1 protein